MPMMAHRGQRFAKRTFLTRYIVKSDDAVYEIRMWIKPGIEKGNGHSLPGKAQIRTEPFLCRDHRKMILGMRVFVFFGHVNV
jgi:hypothetical protein